MGKSAAKSKSEIIPAFASEDEERRFWDEHDPSQYFTEPAEVDVRLVRGTVQTPPSD
jgi:hypothetical protein